MMTEDRWQDFPEAQGGCQCGALRFHISAGPARATLCHCRMCQRASGNAFAPLYEVPDGRISWSGQPKEWASSNLATRGFCDICGTPLYYRSQGTTEIMAGTLTPDFPYRPHDNYGVESRMDWVATLHSLPDRPTSPDLLAGVVSYQMAEGI